MFLHLQQQLMQWPQPAFEHYAQIKAFLPNLTFFQEQLFLGLFHVVLMINLHAYSGQPECPGCQPYPPKKLGTTLQRGKTENKWKYFQSAFWQF